MKNNLVTMSFSRRQWNMIREALKEYECVHQNNIHNPCEADARASEIELFESEQLRVQIGDGLL